METQDGLREDSKLNSLVALTNHQPPDRALSEVRKVEVAPAQVDDLIENDVCATVSVANEMLLKKLYEVDPESEVHRVYVVGNASRYPLIRQILKRELNVRFIEERLIFDEENLKGAVAKGAVVARRLSETFSGVSIEFDKHLSERLPYDIVYEDRTVGPRAIFREHTDYRDLKPVHIDASDKDGRGRKELFLFRRWPGARTEPIAYYSFTFPAACNGPVEVSYDPENHCFWMRQEAAGTMPPAKGEEIVDDTVYRSPVQLGDIPPSDSRRGS